MNHVANLKDEFISMSELPDCVKVFSIDSMEGSDQEDDDESGDKRKKKRKMSKSEQAAHTASLEREKVRFFVVPNSVKHLIRPCSLLRWTFC